MKLIIQLCSCVDGTRSAPVSGERHELAQSMASIKEDYRESTLVLVLMEIPTAEVNTSWEFSRCPLFTVEHFLELFGENNNGTPEILSTTIGDEQSGALCAGSVSGDTA